MFFAGISVSLHSHQLESSESLSLESGSVNEQLVNVSVGVDASGSNDKSVSSNDKSVSSLDDKEFISKCLDLQHWRT